MNLFLCVNASGCRVIILDAMSYPVFLKSTLYVAVLPGDLATIDRLQLV